MFFTRFAPLVAVLLLSACAFGPTRPVFQPLLLDLSGDMAPRDPSLGAGLDVFCAIGHGTAMIDRQWRTYDPTGFTLPGNGQMSSVRIESARGSGATIVRGYYDEPGQKMVFCPMVEGPPDAVIDCASLYAMGEDIAVGFKRTFDVPDAIQSGHISCAHDQERVQPL